MRNPAPVRRPPRFPQLQPPRQAPPQNPPPNKPAEAKAGCNQWAVCCSLNRAARTPIQTSISTTSNTVKSTRIALKSNRSTGHTKSQVPAARLAAAAAAAAAVDAVAGNLLPDATPTRQLNETGSRPPRQTSSRPRLPLRKRRNAFLIERNQTCTCRPASLSIHPRQQSS